MWNRDDAWLKSDILYIPCGPKWNQVTKNIVEIEGCSSICRAEPNTQQMPIIIVDYLRSHQGQYAERNAARTPWNHQVDMKIISLKLNFIKNKLQFALIF
jgi:hypothetical protein